MRRISEYDDYVNINRNTLVTVAEEETDIFSTSDGSNEVVCGYRDGALERYWTLVTCTQPIMGRYVQIQFFVSERLHLYEVEVHGF